MPQEDDGHGQNSNLGLFFASLRVGGGQLTFVLQKSLNWSGRARCKLRRSRSGSFVPAKLGLAKAQHSPRHLHSRSQ